MVSWHHLDLLVGTLISIMVLLTVFRLYEIILSAVDKEYRWLTSFCGFCNIQIIRRKTVLLLKSLINHWNKHLGKFWRDAHLTTHGLHYVCQTRET